MDDKDLTPLEKCVFDIEDRLLDPLREAFTLVRQNMGQMIERDLDTLPKKVGYRMLTSDPNVWGEGDKRWVFSLDLRAGVDKACLFDMFNSGWMPEGEAIVSALVDAGYAERLDGGDCRFLPEAFMESLEGTRIYACHRALESLSPERLDGGDCRFLPEAFMESLEGTRIHACHRALESLSRALSAPEAPKPAAPGMG
jgi:hypothetical protein